jgi:hypothetical protein
MESPPTGADVAGFLGRGSDTAFVALCDIHAPLVAAFVRSYVRGVGFEDPTDPDSDLEDDLRAVIITATARLVVNPTQVEMEAADSYSVRGGFHTWSLPELGVLHRYRRRTA